MSKLCVLAIDDSLTIRRLVSHTLNDAGIEVVTASDGVEGLEKFPSRRFDTVITDINMPNLDGFGVIEGIRAAKQNRRVPVLVLTTESSGAFKDRARSLGATGWIVKPFDEAALVDTVRMVAGRGRS